MIGKQRSRACREVRSWNRTTVRFCIARELTFHLCRYAPPVKCNISKHFNSLKSFAWTVAFSWMHTKAPLLPFGRTGQIYYCNDYNSRKCLHLKSM